MHLSDILVVITLEVGHTQRMEIERFVGFGSKHEQTRHDLCESWSLFMVESCVGKCARLKD